jgi:hypothetical protein
MTKPQAAAAARAFIASVTNPDREWTVSTIETHMPRGWELDEYADAGDFFPLTVANVAAAIMRNKVPA